MLASFSEGTWMGPEMAYRVLDCSTSFSNAINAFLAAIPLAPLLSLAFLSSWKSRFRFLW